MSCEDGGLSRNRPWLFCGCSRWFGRDQVAAASRRNAAPWTVLSRSPAWPIARHAFPRAHDESLRAQIRPPGRTVICLRLHLRAPFSEFLLLALLYPSSGGFRKKMATLM